MTLPKGYGSARRRTSEDEERWRREKEEIDRQETRWRIIKFIGYSIVILVAVVLLMLGLHSAGKAWHEREIAEDNEMIANGCIPTSRNNDGFVTSWMNCWETR